MARGRKPKQPGEKPPAFDEKTTVVAESTSTVEKTVTVLNSPEGAQRKADKKPNIQEKSPEKEKDTAPIVIVSWTDSSGRRRSRQYSCASVRVQEHKGEEFGRSSQKTVLDVSIEASVIEVI